MATSVGEQLLKDLRNDNRKKISVTVKPPVRDPRINLNISGIRFQLLKKTLPKHPGFRLTRILQKSIERKKSIVSENEDSEDLFDYYDSEHQEYYFERNPEIFPSFLTFFSTGHLHIPRNVCVEAFVEECNYWGIMFSPNDCCQGYHQAQWEMIETVRKANRIFNRRQTEMMTASANYISEADNEAETDNDDDVPVKHGKWKQRWRKFKRRVWDLFEEPTSSTQAKFTNFFSSFMVLISTIVLCLNTHPKIAAWLPVKGVNGTTVLDEYNKPKLVKSDNYYCNIIETVCIVWFTFEYVSRCIVSPVKKVFFKSVMNWIDFLAIMPFYVGLIIEAVLGDITDTAFTNVRRFMQILRIFRIIRIFKVARHSAGLQVLGYTVRNSGPELSLLGMLLLMGMTLFASLIYYAEEDVPGTKFQSIIAAFWWAIITMTTVGYGDMAPTSAFGQIVGACCCVSGILFIALPIPTIVSNFSSFYKDHRNKKRVEALYGDEDDEMGDEDGSLVSFDDAKSLAPTVYNIDAPQQRLDTVNASWMGYKRRLSTMSTGMVSNRIQPSVQPMMTPTKESLNQMERSTLPNVENL